MIHADPGYTGDTRRQQSYERSQADQSQAESHHSSGEGQYETLAHQVGQEPSAPGTQSRAHRQLPVLLGGPFEQDVGDIGTGNEEHHSDNPHEYQQREATVSCHRFLEMDQTEPGIALFISGGEEDGDSVGDHVKLGAGQIE